MEIGRFYDLIFSIAKLDPIDFIGWLLSITVISYDSKKVKF